MDVKEEVSSSAGNVELDRYNSELHIALSNNNKVGEVIKGDGFQYMWGGVRATCGVTKGMVSKTIFFRFVKNYVPGLIPMDSLELVFSVIS